VALHGLPRNVPDVRLEPDYRMVYPDTHSELCVPIKTGNRVLGVINVESDEVNAFTQADERLLATLSGQLATAIERIHLFEQTQRQAREISGLYDIALTTSSVLDADALLERIYRQVQQLIKPDTFMIVLSGEEPGSCAVA
jgi:sigma-B regulation protein RsbU (phosphoserine phosphatase)